MATNAVTDEERGPPAPTIMPTPRPCEPHSKSEERCPSSDSGASRRCLAPSGTRARCPLSAFAPSGHGRFFCRRPMFHAGYSASGPSARRTRLATSEPARACVRAEVTAGARRVAAAGHPPGSDGPGESESERRKQQPATPEPGSASTVASAPLPRAERGARRSCTSGGGSAGRAWRRGSVPRGWRRRRTCRPEGNSRGVDVEGPSGGSRSGLSCQLAAIFRFSSRTKALTAGRYA